ALYDQCPRCEDDPADEQAVDPRQDRPLRIRAAIGQRRGQKSDRFRQRDFVDAAVACGGGFLPRRGRCYLDLRVSKMTSQGPSKDEEKGRVLPFRPRAPRSWNERMRDKLRNPVEDLSKYSRDPDEDNFQHRMKVNLLAFAVLALIVACGIWLTS